MTDNNSIADQAYLAKNSLGFIGNMSGPTSLFGVLNKDGSYWMLFGFIQTTFLKFFIYVQKNI